LWTVLSGVGTVLTGFEGGIFNSRSNFSMSHSRFVKIMLVVALAAVCLGNSQAFADPRPTPEIHPESFGSVMALLVGSLALLERRSLLK
jgi:hypothetical protein